ncbi:MAG: hypothetical protein AAF658_02160, partial [Myxococcota bacterium]
MSRWTVVGAMCCALACGTKAKDAQTPLIVGEARDFPLGDAPIELSVPVQAGDYVRFNVEQKGVDAAVFLRDSEGTELARARRIYGRRGIEVIEARSATSDLYSLEVSSRFPNLDEGTVRVTLVARRPPTETDERRLQAARGVDRGSRLASKRKWQESIAELKASAQAWRELSDASGELIALMGEAQVLTDADRYEDALACYERAATLAATLEDASTMSRVFRGRGNVRLRTGELLAALSDYERSIELAVRSGDHKGIAGGRLNSGLVHYQLGEPEEALSEMQAATAGFASLGDEFGLSFTYRGVAEAFMALGDSTRAKEALDQGFKAAKRFSFNRAGLLRERGRLHLRHLGNSSVARKAFDEAAVLFREANADSHLAEVLHWRGLAFESEGDLDKAKADHQAALEIQRRVGALSMAAESVRGLGRIAAKRRQWRQARELFARAAREQQKQQRVPALIEVLNDWARAELSAGRLSEARAKSDQAVELVESIRAEVERVDLQTTFADTVRSVFDTAVDIALRTPGGAEARATASFAIAERGRAQALLETLRRAPQGELLVSADPKLRADLRAARRALRQEMLELRRGLEGANNNEEEARALERSVFKSIDAYETLRSRALRADRAEWFPAPPSLEEVRDAMGERAALLVYSLREPESTAWLLTARSLAVEALPGQSTLFPLVTYLRERLSQTRQRVA